MRSYAQGWTGSKASKFFYQALLAKRARDDSNYLLKCRIRICPSRDETSEKNCETQVYILYVMALPWKIYPGR